MNAPDTLHDVNFIERDSKRFADSGGWGSALFDYDAASDTFKPDGNGAKCGYACHAAVAAKDYIFTRTRTNEPGTGLSSLASAPAILRSVRSNFSLRGMRAAFEYGYKRARITT